MNDTIEQAMNTKLPAKILSVEDFEHKGAKRQSIKAKKARGKRVYTVIKYETGLYSEAV